MRFRSVAGVTAVAAILAATSIGARGEERDTRVLRGWTQEGLPVSVALEGSGRLRTVDVSWEGPCPTEGYIGGIKRTRRTVDVPIAADGSFAWSGREHFELDGVGDGLDLSLRLEGRVATDGTASVTWRTGGDATPGEQVGECLTVTTDAAVQERAVVPSEIAPGIRATPLDDDGAQVAVTDGQAWVVGSRLADTGRSVPAVTRVDASSGEILKRFDVQGGTLGARGDSAFLGGTESTNDGRTERLKVSRLEDARARALRQRRGLAYFDPHVEGLAVTEGAVWVMEERVLRKISARTGRTVRTIRAPTVSPTCKGGGQFAHLAAWGQHVWAVVGQMVQCDEPEPIPRLVRIDARTGRITRTTLLRRGAQTLAAGPAGLWTMVDDGRRQLVRRIDVRDDAPRAHVTVPLAHVEGQLAVGRRSVWLVGRGPKDRDVLQRLTPGAARTTVVHQLRGRGSTVAVRGDEGWIVDRGRRELLRASP